MQPNLKVPQAPYVISPTSRIPRSTVMDASLDALIQQKIREAQYAQQQQAVASRTPTVLFDPLLNLRVRDYYRQKYERTVASELAGRLVGGVEGGALGAGIGASIGGIINTILTVAGVIEPTPIGEVAAAIGWSALAGATIGTAAGTAASDYSTWYATKDMFKNMWFDQSVGRGILNTMYFAGQSMDLASTATIVKSTLYSLVTGEEITGIVRKAYGLTKEGRTDMDFSLIREALNLDFGGIGNFIFDMSGEMSSDLGAIAGIAGSVMDTSKGLTKVYTKIMTEAGQKIMTEDALGKSVSKAFVRFIREGNVDDAMLYIKKLKLSNPEWIDDSLDMDNLRPVMEKYFKEINESAKKSVAVRLANSFKNIDLVDDFMTHTLWKAGSPVILGSSLLKEAKAHSILPKALQTMFGDEKAMEIYEFFSGNFAKAKGIINPMSSAKIKNILKKQHYSFIENLVDDNGFKRFKTTIAEYITDDLQRQEFYKILEEEGIDDIVKLKNSKNTIVKTYYEKSVKESYEKLNKLELEIEEKRNAQQILIKRLESGKGTTEDGKKLVELENEINAIIASDEYKSFSYIKLMLEQPEEIRQLSKIVSTLYHLQRKQQFLGKLSSSDQDLLNKSFSTLVNEVTKGNKLVESFFEQYDYMNVGSGKLTKSLKEFISENMDSSIRKQFDDFYQGKITKFENFATDSLPAFKKSWVEQMVKRLQKAKIDVDKIFKGIDPNDIDAKYKAIKSFLDNYDDVDSIKMTLDKRTKAFKIKEELDKKIQEITIFQNRYNSFINTKSLLYDEAYRYTGYASQAVLRKRSKLIEEAMEKILSTDIPREAIEEFVGNINDYVEFLGKDIIKDEFELAKYLNSLMEAMLSVQPNTGKLSRVINNMIPKYLKWIKNIQEWVTPETFEIFNNIDDIKDNINVIFSSLKSNIDDLINNPAYKSGMSLVGYISKLNSNSPKFIPSLPARKYAIQYTLLSSFLSDIFVKGTFGKDITEFNYNNIYDKLSTYITESLLDPEINIEELVSELSSRISTSGAFSGKTVGGSDSPLALLLNTLNPFLSDEHQKYIKEYEILLDNYKQYKNSPEYKIFEQVHSVVSNMKSLTDTLKNLEPKTGATSKSIKSQTSKIAQVIQAEKFKNKVLEEVEKIEKTLLRNSQDEQLRSIIKDIKSLFGTENFLSIDTYKVMNKIYELQERQIRVAFKDIDNKSINFKEAVARAEESFKDKQTRLLEKLIGIRSTVKNEKVVQLVKDFIEKNKELKQEQINSLPKELKNLVKDYIEIKKHLSTVEQLASYKNTVDTIYSGLNAYVKDLQTSFKTDTNEIYTAQDMVDDYILSYIDGLTTDFSDDYTYVSRRIYYDADIQKHVELEEKVDVSKSPFNEKDIPNRYFAGRRLVDTLELCKDSMPMVYSYFVKLVKNFIDNDFNGKITPELRNTFVDELRQLLTINEQIRTLYRINFIDTNSLVVRNGKLIPSKQLPKTYGKLLKTVINLSEDDLMRIDLVKDKLRKGINEILTEEDIDNLPPKFSKAINDIKNGTTTTEKVAAETAGGIMSDILNKHFVDGLFSYEKPRSSFIRKAKNIFIGDPDITKKSFVVFDTETTGETSHGVYSIYATRWTYDGQKWIAEKGIQFCLDPDFIEANWKIDLAVDKLNAKSSRQFLGSTLGKAKQLRDDALYNGRPVYKSDQEMAEAFRAYLQEGDILVAHNSAFDFSELMNAMSGGQFMKQGVIDDVAAEEFAKTDFDFTIMDTALLQSYTGIFGDTKQLTNSWLGRASGLVDVVEVFTDANNKKTYFVNGVEVKKIQTTKDKVLRFEYDAEDNLVKGSYNGGDLHEAANDVELMNAWFEGGLNKLTETGVKLSDLDKPDMFFDNMMKDRLNIFYTKEFKQKIKLLLDNFKGVDLDGEPNLVGRIKDCLLTIQDESLSYKERMTSVYELEDIIYNKPYQDYIKQGRVNFSSSYVYNNIDETFSVEEITDDFIAYNTAVTRDISKIRGIYEKEIIGHLKVNSFYTKIVQSMNFKYNSTIQNLVDLFNNNANGTLSGNLQDVAERLVVISKDPQYELAFTPIKEIQQILKDMDDSMTWYTELISETEPVMYDTLDNVIRKIQSGEYHNKPKDIIYRDILLFVQKRASQNNFDYIKAVEMVNKVLQNVDEIRIPDSDRISNLYNKCLDAFSALLQHLQTVGANQKNDALAGNAKEMLDLIHDAIESMRSPLRNIKAENKLQKLMPFTAREFNEMSMISEDTVNKLKSQGHTFDYMGKPIEFDPTTHMHRMTPGESIAWRSKLVPSFTDEHLDGISIKSKINDMLSSLFKKTEGGSYKALPYIDADQSRLVQYFRLASTAFGIDLESLVNTVYRTGAYKNFEKNFTKYNELFNQLLGSSDEELVRLNIDKLALNQFVSQVMSINEFTFEYISDSNILKQTIIATAMHNLLYGNYKVFDAVPLGVWSDLSETAEEALGKFTHEPFLEAQMNDSIKLFSDVKAIFTNLNGTYDVEGFFNYLNTHPDYFLVYMDTNGKFIRLENTSEIINEVLSSDDIFVTIMPKNSFNQLTNYIQPIKLGPKIRWFQQNILRPMKMMSLTNLNFTFQNVMSATFQNMISTSGKVNAPKAISYMVRMARDYHRYNNLFISVTSSYTARKYLTGSLYTMDKRWIDLLDDDNFKLTLKANGEEDVLEIINKLTSEDIERFKFINEARNTSAARGEISSITLNNKREEALKREADEARAKLVHDYPDRYQEMLDDISKFKNDPDYDKIAPLVSQVNHRRYQEMSIEDLQKLLDELENKPNLDYYEKRQKYALKKVIKDKQSGFWDAIFKHQAVSWWFDMNENLETIFRLSAMDMYIKEGSTFDEATAEVIKRHFIYNNKSAAEQYAEFVIPFISYPLRMLSLVDDIASDSTVMDMMFWFDKYSWGEEEHEQSDYLTRRKARGDIPVGNKLFSLGSPFKEGVMNFQNPLYSLNNKINPLAKPFIDLATGSEYNRWNQLPGVSIVNGYANIIKERSLVANFTNDYYRYERFTNYYRPRVNNKIYGSLYNRMYTKSGHSRVLMNMQPLSSSNLKYRVNSIMKYSGPTNTRR